MAGSRPGGEGRELEEAVEGSSGLARAEALGRLAWALRYEDQARAASLAEEARGLALAARASRGAAAEGADSALALALLTLGRVEADLGRHGAAIERLLEAEALYRARGDAASLLQVRNGLGRVFYYLADYSEAIRHYRLALESAELLGDELSAARALLNIGLSLLKRGELEASIEPMERSLAVFGGRGEAAGRSIALDGLAHAELLRGDFEKALCYARASLEAAVEGGVSLSQTDARCTLADALAGLGRPAEALAEAERAEDYARARGLRNGEVEAMKRRGDLLRRLGRLEEALSALAEAARAAEALGGMRLRYETEFALAVALREAGRWEESYRRFQSFAEIKREAAAFGLDARRRVLAPPGEAPDLPSAQAEARAAGPAEAGQPLDRGQAREPKP